MVGLVLFVWVFGGLFGFVCSLLVLFFFFKYTCSISFCSFRLLFFLGGLIISNYWNPMTSFYFVSLGQAYFLLCKNHFQMIKLMKVTLFIWKCQIKQNELKVVRWFLLSIKWIILEHWSMLYTLLYRMGFWDKTELVVHLKKSVSYNKQEATSMTENWEGHARSYYLEKRSFRKHSLTCQVFIKVFIISQMNFLWPFFH